jgi:two-component system sensor kinase FixL
VASSHRPLRDEPPDPVDDARGAQTLSTEMMRLFIEDAPDSVVVSDERGRITFINQQGERVFGYARAEVLGQGIDVLLPERFRPQHVGHRAGYYAEPRTRPMGMGLELFAQRKDGTEFPVEISLSHVRMAEGLRIIAIVRDITARKQLEEALRASQREADRLKDEFIAIAAHELRNPLAALRGFADMLHVQTARGHGPELAEWQMEAIEAIDQSSARLAELTDDLLDVTRLQAGKLELHLGAHDLVTLARRVIARQQTTTQRHSLSLAATQEPITVQIDEMRFEQVLNNLVHNAIKYSPDGGDITLALQVDAAAQTVTLCVADQGIGIPASEQGRIFGRFARAENAQGIGGTGLGLYLCRELVERHQGRITFTSQEGVGSTFCLTLPLRISAD